jgi:hypothetical protein
MLPSLIYTLGQGDGAMRDVDRLGADESRRSLLELEQVPGSRRVGEYLGRFEEGSLARLAEVGRRMAKTVAEEVIAHELKEQGYIPVFMDGSGIEVSGEEFEGAGPLYDGSPGYWLHGVFVGSLWTAQWLWPGGVEVAKGWKEQLAETAELLGKRSPVWVRLDNAYYRKEVAEGIAAQGWDYSVSVTSATYKRPLKEILEAFQEEDWRAINAEGAEHAAFLYHQPAGWEKEQVYVVVRSQYEGRQKLIFPRYTFILVSREDLPLDELVRRHRGKQGQENALKGPLIHLDLHHPPCEKFFANRALYTLGQIAQILLVAVQYFLLPVSARVHSLRPLIRDLVRTAAKLVRHARRLTLLFAKSALRLDWIAHASDRLETLARVPATS